MRRVGENWSKSVLNLSSLAGGEWSTRRGE